MKNATVGTVVAGLMGVSAGLAMLGAADSGSDQTKPRYTADGKLKTIDPEVFRDWVQLGTPVTPNDLNNGEAAFPEFHAVYVPQWAWAEYKKTAKWPDGTILAKELIKVGDKKAPSGAGYFEGEFNGLDVAVKDKSKGPDAPGNWMFYNFNHSKPPYAAEAAAQPKANCSSCHESNAGPEADYVFSKYYPKVKAAAAKVKK